MRELIPYPVVEIRATALAGGGWRRRLRGLSRLPLAILDAWRALRQFRPHLLIAAGGYVSGPAGVGAWLQRIPVLVLEQNAVPGLTTRWLTPIAAKVAASFPDSLAALGAKAVLTGNPVRSELPTADHAAGRREGSSELRLLILGGSQGAHGLNMMVERALPILTAKALPLRVVHQTGAADLPALERAYRQHRIPATVSAFMKHIASAYAWADLVCARAGATTIAELTHCGLPSILVPFPHATANHQHANAAVLAAAGGARIVEQEEHGDKLALTILELATNRDLRQSMAAGAASLATPDAADRVADLVVSLTRWRCPTRSSAVPAQGPGAAGGPEGVRC